MMNWRDQPKKRAARCALVAGFVWTAGACDRLPGSEGSPDEDAEVPIVELDSSQVARLPAGTTAEMAATGGALYPACAVCHGFDGEGTQLGPDLRGGDWIHITGGVDEIARIIRTGVEDPEEYPIPMPRMGGADLDEEQIRALATYVYLLGDQPATGTSSPASAAP